MASALVSGVLLLIAPAASLQQTATKESSAAGLQAHNRSHWACAADSGTRGPFRKTGAVELEFYRDETGAEQRFRRYNHGTTPSRLCASAKDDISVLQPLVLPQLKLAFCYVPKVACSQFKDLFNFLNGKGEATLGFGHHYITSMTYMMGIPKTEVTRENGWKFATFTRDPVLRYFSAFGSTCVSKDDGSYEHDFACCGPLTNSSVPKAAMAESIEERVRFDRLTGIIQHEDHWASQSRVLAQCGWDLFNPSNLDYLGQLSGDVNAQVKEMLAMVGFHNNTVVDRFFPREAVAGHTNPIHGTAKELLSIQSLVGIMKLYQEDYELLPGVGCSFSQPFAKELAAKQVGA